MRSVLLLLFFMVLSGCEQNQPFIIKGQTMGTTYHVVLANPNVLSPPRAVVQAKIDSLLRTVNLQMSTYLEESEITRFNRFAGREPFRVSPAFTRVLKLALKIYDESGGAFDVTVGPLVNLWGFGTDGQRATPPDPARIRKILKQVGSRYITIVNDSTIRKTNPAIQLDFSAIAKGYGVDAVAGMLQKLGFSNFLVEIGGEVVTRGGKNGQPWKIGIDRPLPEALPGTELEKILELHDAAMATSGDYRNYFTSGDSAYSHEIDPRTGRPVRNMVASATVLAPSCMEADAMATALMVMGAKKGLAWVESKTGVEAFIILHDGKNFKEIGSSGFFD